MSFETNVNKRMNAHMELWPPSQQYIVDMIGLRSIGVVFGTYKTQTASQISDGLRVALLGALENRDGVPYSAEGREYTVTWYREDQWLFRQSPGKHTVGDFSIEVVYNSTRWYPADARELELIK